MREYRGKQVTIMSCSDLCLNDEQIDDFFRKLNEQRKSMI